MPKRANEDSEGGKPKKKVGVRTSQACDRCRIRKIRCDGRVGGCTPCLSASLSCQTTDRITGRATTRGHTEQIENENTSLKMYMLELQQQLRESGIEPKAPPSVPYDHTYWNQDEEQQGTWGNLSTGAGMGSSTARLERDNSQNSLLPEFRPGCIGDNYLGVSSGNSFWLSPIEGTALQLFGMKIDLAEFMPPETDPLAAPMSYQTFLLHAFGKSKLTPKPQLPTYDEIKVYSDWYFKSVQVFIPILHKRDFMCLINRMYHENYQPNAAEITMVHMVLAIMNFQYSVRNPGTQPLEHSMSHYHYALSFIPDLITGHTLQDVQALVLICTQLRSQPRLGAAWMFTNTVFGLAIELGLHRSADAWQVSATERDSHHIEMRKRIFWTILMLHVNFSGKLGRPMPIRLEDFDIEIPECVPDYLPEEEATLSEARRCTFRAAIPGYKLLRILIQVYGTVYSIRSSPESYEVNLRNLDKQLNIWREQLPPELTGGDQTIEEDQCAALYLQTSEHGIRLLLHHPSLCKSDSPQVVQNNLDVCLDSSRKLLIAASQLKTLKSLDTTWLYTTEYLAAIFTTLFVYTQRPEQMASTEFQQLKQDMDAWLDLMEGVSSLLGTSPRLPQAIRSITEYSLSNIGRHLAAKTASAGLASAGSPPSPSQHTPQQHIFSNPTVLNNAYVNNTPNGDRSHTPRYAMGEAGVSHEQQNNLRQPSNHFYSDPQVGPGASFPSGPMQNFDVSAYSTEETKPNLHAGLTTPNGPMGPPQPIPQQAYQDARIAPHQASTAFVAPFHSPATPQNGFHAPHQGNTPNCGPAAWRDFADNMMTNIGGQDYLTPANALMALGADKHHGVDVNAAGVASLAGLPMAPDAQQPWPLIVYNTGPGYER